MLQEQSCELKMQLVTVTILAFLSIQINLTRGNKDGLFMCYADVCNTSGSEQFCSSVERRCRDCLDIRDDCFTSRLPLNCSSTCIKYNTDLAILKAKETACAELNDIINGSHNGSLTHLHLPGDVIGIICNPGYRLSGSITVECKEFGQWDHDMPTCEDIKCQNPPLIRNGYWHTADKLYNIGDAVHAACDDGYETDDADTWTCSEEGEWISPAQLFTPVCSVRGVNAGLSVWMVTTIVLGIISAFMVYCLVKLLKDRSHLCRNCKYQYLDREDVEKSSTDHSETGNNVREKFNHTDDGPPKATTVNNINIAHFISEATNTNALSGIEYTVAPAESQPGERGVLPAERNSPSAARNAAPNTTPTVRGDMSDTYAIPVEESARFHQAQPELGSNSGDENLVSGGNTSVKDAAPPLGDTVYGSEIHGTGLATQQSCNNEQDIGRKVATMNGTINADDLDRYV